MAIAVLLPADALNDARDEILPRPDSSLVFDPDGGSWYRYVRTYPTYALTIEGDDRLLVSANGCAAKVERYAYLGTAFRTGSSMAEQDEGPNKEVLFVEDCVPYRINIECLTDKYRECAAAKRSIGDRQRTSLVRLSSLRMPQGALQRSLVAAAVGDDGQNRTAPRPAGSEP